MSHARTEHRHSSWSREHGAYVQLLGPLCCALAFASPTLAAGALAAAGCAAFVAHEPLLIVLGRRGERTRASLGASARWLLAGLSLTITLSCAALHALERLPVSFAVATAPFALIAVLLASHVLTPRGPKTVGWILTAANLFAVVAFGMGLRGLLG